MLLLGANSAIIISYRYLYETSAANSATWAELSLIEWESKLTLAKDSTMVLKEANSKAQFMKLHDNTSPASIVVFSLLYNITSSARLSEYPALEKFFVGFLATEPAKKGIELATAYTAQRKDNASTVVSASTPSDKSKARGARNLRSGIFANKLDGKKMCLHLAKHNLIVVCLFQGVKTFLSPQLYLMSTTSHISAISLDQYSVQMSSLAIAKFATSMHFTSVGPTSMVQLSRPKPLKRVSLHRKFAINIIKFTPTFTNGSTSASTISAVQQPPSKPRLHKEYSLG